MRRPRAAGASRLGSVTGERLDGTPHLARQLVVGARDIERAAGVGEHAASERHTGRRHAPCLADALGEPQDLLAGGLDLRVTDAHAAAALAARELSFDEHRLERTRKTLTRAWTGEQPVARCRLATAGAIDTISPLRTRQTAEPRDHATMGSVRRPPAGRGELRAIERSAI